MNLHVPCSTDLVTFYITRGFFVHNVSHTVLLRCFTIICICADCFCLCIDCWFSSLKESKSNGPWGVSRNRIVSFLNSSSQRLRWMACLRLGLVKLSTRFEKRTVWTHLLDVWSDWSSGMLTELLVLLYLFCCSC
jgi:hypothetical protein